MISVGWNQINGDYGTEGFFVKDDEAANLNSSLTGIMSIIPHRKKNSGK